MNRKAITTILATALALIVFYFIFASHPVDQSADSSVEMQPTDPTYKGSVNKPDDTQTANSLESPTERPVRDFRAEQNQDEEKFPPSNHNAGRTKLVERLEPALQERLSSEGFSQYEIDITKKEVVDEYIKVEGTINFTDAVNRAAKALNLDDDRRSNLNVAVLQSAAESVEITFDQWKRCLSYRVKAMPQCVQDIAQELSRSVAAATSGQSLLGEEGLIGVELSKKAMDDAMKKCGITADEADRALRIVLSDCP
jgi:hypothetical protein